MKKIVLLFLIFYFLLPAYEISSFKSKEARLIFFDVGQGDSVMLISPKGKTLLIDGGPDKLILEKLAKLLPRDQTKIDWVILSHDHADHYIGLISLLDYYSISQVIAPVWSNNSAVNYWLNILDKQETELININQKMNRFFLEPGCYFDILASPLLFSSSNVSSNNSSFSIKIDCFGLEALLTGDLEEAGERALLEQADIDFLKSPIFKAGHHGSDTSNHLNFLEVVNPEIIVISVGDNNRYKHPGKNIFINANKIGAKVLRTDINGDIEFIFKEEEVIMKIENF
jgi:competence protein ComEC